MAVADVPKRLASPVICGQVKLFFWFLDGNEKAVILYFGSYNNMALAMSVSEGVGKELRERLLQKLRINGQHRVAGMDVPCDFRAFSREVMSDFLAQIFREIRSLVRDQAGFDFADCFGKRL